MGVHATRGPGTSFGNYAGVMQDSRATSSMEIYVISAGIHLGSKESIGILEEPTIIV